MRTQYIISHDYGHTTNGKIIDIIWVDHMQNSWAKINEGYRELGFKPGHMPAKRGNNPNHGKEWYLANGYK